MDSHVYAKNRGNIIVGAIVVGVLIVACIAGFLYAHTRVSHGDSFHPNAWKFAELVKDGTLYPVDHVVDGDTLVVNIQGHEITVRMIGMDTPETVDPRKPVECFGPEASAEAKRIFGNGDGKNAESAKSVNDAEGVNGAESANDDTVPTEIRLEKDPAVGDYDIYGRLLAYVYPPARAVRLDGTAFPDGLSYNEYMIQNGFAREYDYKNQVYKYRTDFKASQSAAKSAHLGVWDKKICPKPFSY